jgi:5-methylcytosine-specific restriction endonuclease McrA
VSRARTAAVSRLVTFGPGPAAAGWAWVSLHDFGHLYGLGVLTAAITWAWLLLVVTLVSAGEHPWALLVPAGWRQAWRRGWLWHRERDGQKAQDITGRQRRIIHAADRNQCVYCHRGYRHGVVLHIDHYRPFRKGGVTMLRNLFTLCADHNLIKSDAWPDGRYHPIPGYRNRKVALAILAAERRARYNPARLCRLAWALAA